MSSKYPLKRTLLDIVGIMLFSLAITAVVSLFAFNNLSENVPYASAQEDDEALLFPGWTLDCSQISDPLINTSGEEVSGINWLEIDHTFDAKWFVPQDSPSSGWLGVDSVGERDTYAIARIVSAKDMLDWASEVRSLGLQPNSSEAIALANAKGSFEVKTTDELGKAHFKFHWSLFAPEQEQLSIAVKGCKSLPNESAGDEDSFYQLTFPNPIATITSIGQVYSVCTSNCNVTQLFDCEHMPLTPVIAGEYDGSGVYEDMFATFPDDGTQIVQNLPAPAAYDKLGTLIEPTDPPYIEGNLSYYDKHPSQTEANTGLLNGMGEVGYFMGPGARASIEEAPDLPYQFANAAIISDFVDYFSDPEVQPRRIRSGTRDWIAQPKEYLSFSSDIRLTCLNGTCGIPDSDGNIILNLENPGATMAPFQLLIFVPSVDGDINGDTMVNDLDELPSECVDDISSCYHTVTGRITGISGSRLYLYAGGSSEIYETKELVVSGDTYTFTDVVPGIYALMVDKHTNGNPCHFAEEVLVGVGSNKSSWNITESKTVTVEDFDGGSQCNGPSSS